MEFPSQLGSNLKPESSSCKTPPELAHLAELVGSFIEYWGFKNVHGRIWTHLFLSSRPLDAADLMARLKISKALVSMSIKDLLAYEVIVEMPDRSHRGTILYGANPQVVSVIMNVLRTRENRLMGHIHAAFEAIKQMPDAEKQSCCLDAARTESMGELIVGAQTVLAGLLALKAVDFSEWKNLS